MSGICGIVSLDGSEPSAAQIEAIIDPLERRGPDGRHHWRDGQVALGQTLLATTPEALVEVLPLTDPANGCTITADVRLDNREELIAALGLAGETRMIGDGELILRAYMHWGEDCPTHLLGDFAFAIWDSSANQLFCARDHMGIRQFSYYHEPGEVFVFATEPEAVLAHAGVPQRINEGRIADFLDDLEGFDLTSTFFEGVSRLPPAHTLMVNGNGLSPRRYWELRAPRELKLETDEAYAAAFRAVFTEAVRCRLRSAGPVGSMLSGGMDSGSVVAVATRLLVGDERAPLQTFSAVGPDSDSCIETRTILAAAALPGLAPHFVNHADLSEYRDELMRLTDGAVPFDSHMTLMRAVYLAAHRAAVKVVLDGGGGDLVLSPGNCVVHWLRRGRIIKAIHEARAEVRFYGPQWPAWESLVKAAWSAFVPSSIRTIRRKVAWRMQDRRIGADGLISRSFASKVHLKARRKQFRRHLGDGPLGNIEERVQSILHPHLVAASERYDRVASAVAIEPRDPFMDIRVIEFCLSLPWQQLQADGWPKIVLRRAMNGLLLDPIIWRRGKEHLGWTFTQALYDGWSGWREQLCGGQVNIGRFANLIATTSNAHKRKALDNQQAIRLFSLLRWIQQHGTRLHNASMD